MSFDHLFIMEHLDKFATDPFAEDLHALPIPSKNIEAASKLIEDFKNTHADLNAAIHERNEVDKKMKATSSEFEINELEEAFLDCH